MIFNLAINALRRLWISSASGGMYNVYRKKCLDPSSPKHYPPFKEIRNAN